MLDVLLTIKPRFAFPQSSDAVRFDIELLLKPAFRFSEYLYMAKLSPNVFAWNAPTAKDWVSIRLRYRPAPDVVLDTDPFIDLGKVTQFDAAQMPEFAGIDGVFNLAIAAVDDGGNESDMTRLDNVPLDLVQPDAPTNFHRA